MIHAASTAFQQGEQHAVTRDEPETLDPLMETHDQTANYLAGFFRGKAWRYLKELVDDGVLKSFAFDGPTPAMEEKVTLVFPNGKKLVLSALILASNNFCVQATTQVRLVKN